MLDIVGGDYFEKNFSLLKVEGRLVQIACMKGAKAVIDLHRLHFKRLTVLGSTLRAQSTEAKTRIAKNFKTMSASFRKQNHKACRYRYLSA